MESEADLKDSYCDFAWNTWNFEYFPLPNLHLKEHYAYNSGLIAGPQQFPAVTPPPIRATQESIYAPASAPAPSLHAGGTTLPGSTGAVLPPLGSFPASGPAMSTAGSFSSGSSLVNPFAVSQNTVAFFVLLVCLVACHGFWCSTKLDLFAVSMWPNFGRLMRFFLYW